ncbi:cellulase family glycosylhydrolase [Mycolicibacterium sp. GCM10028919]|uniref:cellulase family glycosylhydrolase n=1 Tax=Mycolicibacterium sp. GCM10028919 TaxID=3273401 RepID=UPI00361487D9
MAKSKERLLRRIATRSVLAALPVAIASAYASGIFIEPPRLAEAKFQTVAEISTTPSTVGIATSPLYGQPKAAIEKQLDDMLAIGVTNIRVFVPWGLVEPIDNFYNWSSIDDIMTAAAARNMGVLAEVNGTPVWGVANGPNLPFGSGVPNANLFKDFMSTFATRYKGTVSAYEIWNEPNYFQFLNPIDPVAYANLLKAVYPVLKAIDPTATVVAGAVGATQTFPGFTMSPVEFVQKMLAAGAADFFDALSVHPYGDQIKYSGTCPSCPATVLTPREQVEAIMALVTGKKVWITEYGVATGPAGVSEAQQAAWIKDLLDHWQTYDPDVVGPVFLHTVRDFLVNPQNPADLENFFGLWDVLGNPKDAAQMLKDWIAAHPPGTTTPPPGPGTGTPTNPLAQFFAAMAQMAKSFQSAIGNLFNPGGFIQGFVNAISNLFGFLRPTAPAATVATLALTEPEPDPTVAGKLAATVEPEGDATVVADEGIETVSTEPSAEPAAETPADLEPVVAEVDPVVVETPVEAPPVVEVSVPEVSVPEVVAPEVAVPDVTAEEPAPVDEQPDEPTSVDGSEGKPSTESATSTKTGDSSSSTKSDASDSTSPSKTEDSKTESSNTESSKTGAKTTKSTTDSGADASKAGSTSSAGASSSGSSSDSSSSGSDD